MACSACSRARRSAATSCSIPPPWKTCAARPSRRSRRSKSSTRRVSRDRLDIVICPRASAPAIDVATGSRLPCRQRRRCCSRRATRRRQERDARSLAADYPEGPARPAAEHVPGLRLAARRPAHAPHGDDPVGLGLLRLRPDLHLAFLRRAAHGRLRAVQLRIARHRQALRGHPRRGVQARQARRLTTPSWSSTSACRPRRACRSTCCRRRSTACGSSASTCRASACRRMPRPRTCWPAPCCATPATRPRQGPVQRAARGGRASARPSR